MFVQLRPWSDFSRLENAVNHLFDNGAAAAAAARADEPAAPTWTPAVDIREDADRIELIADLPGVDENDLSISVDKNVLSLKGERKAPEAGEARSRRVERVFGPFSRAFTLPPSVDAESIQAALKNGVLTLTLPKRPSAQPRSIKVNIA